MNTIKNIIAIGAPAKGDDFFDREEMIMEIWETLERSNILLIGPRRFGKTSIMLELKNNPKNKFMPFFFEIEHLESPEEFILYIIEEIKKNEGMWNKVKSGIFSFFKAADGKIEELEISSIRMKLRETKDNDWKKLGSHLINLMTKDERKILLILDEFPEMIKLMIKRDKKNKTNEADVFLRWFRAIRQSMLEEANLRFVVGGSLCLVNLLREINSVSQINEMTKIKVGPFSDENATKFIKALLGGAGKEIEDDISEAIIKQIGSPIPFFIQIMVVALLRESRNLKRDITPEFVEEVYEKYLLGVDYKSEFDHYHLRLSEYYVDIGGQKDIVAVAKAILTELSMQNSIPKVKLYDLYLHNTEQSADVDGFGCLMALLEDEFYLEYDPETEEYCFLSKLLKDWWYRHFGMLKNYGERVVI